MCLCVYVCVVLLRPFGLASNEPKAKLAFEAL